MPCPVQEAVIAHPGRAAAGIVETVGDGVTSAKPGDRVAVQVEYGAYAEKLKSAAATCYPMPDGMPFEDAAAPVHYGWPEYVTTARGEGRYVPEAARARAASPRSLPISRLPPRPRTKTAGRAGRPRRRR
jgi:NADPH:quinone reductase-like Zn-dependent oxidoreductase